MHLDDDRPVTVITRTTGVVSALAPFAEFYTSTAVPDGNTVTTTIKVLLLNATIGSGKLDNETGG
jgi:hypothetical protein